MINDIHTFKCGGCKRITPHREVNRYDTEGTAEMAPEVWLLECQNCFEMRIIDPAERLIGREDDITRCDQCGNYKMKSANCRICKIAAGQEKIKETYWTGGQTLTRFIDADI